VDRVLHAAASVSREITMLQSVDQVLERILDVAITYLGTERGVIALLDPDTGELRVRLARNIDRESIGDGLVISRSTLHASGIQGAMVHSGDALADPRLNVHESIRTGRIRSLVALPIQLEKQVLGALYMDHRQLTDLFGPEERLFLRFIADMAAVGIRNAQRFEFAEDRARNLRGELTEEEFVFPNTIVGRGPRMREMVRRGLQAVRTGRIVLLTGENGVGKDHFAHILHRMSKRPGDLVDCPLPTLPQTLIHSLLFGAVKGIATDLETRAGYVENAQGGTLFLNEIADLPMELQPMLLHFLETGEFRRVGGSNVLRLDANIVCATNANLETRVEEGTFREDLYYRLTQCVIQIPPLRERAEDIPDFVDLFLRQAESRLKRDRTVLHPLALDLLVQCGWEGNVRELKNCILSSLDQTTASVIERRHLDSRSLRKLLHGEDRSGIRDAVDAVEVRRIHDAMERSGGVITRAATHLGLTEAALRRRIKRHRLGHLVLQRRQKRVRR
jgi:transcriptional regulator with GAF, ATPase, and Fis domain